METLLYLVLVVIGFFVFIQLFIKISTIFKKGKQAPQVSGALGQKIQAGQKVLVYFFSPTCSACKVMTPVVDRMRKDNPNVFKIDVTQKPEISRAFGVMGTPATILVENKKIAQYALGARPERFLTGLVD